VGRSVKLRLVKVEKEGCRNVEVVSKVLDGAGGELNSLTLEER